MHLRYKERKQVKKKYKERKQEEKKKKGGCLPSRPRGRPGRARSEERRVGKEC